VSIVAALVPNPVRLFRLRGALRHYHSVEPCADWAAVTLLCERHPVQLAVLDVFATGGLSLEPLRHLKRRFPGLTTVAYVTVTAENARDLFDLGRAGVDALIVADQDDDPTTIAAIVEQAQARSVASRLRVALAHARPTVRDAVMLSVTRAHERLTTETLAETLSLSRRVLAKHLEQASLPSPQRLITWGRLVIAAHLLEDPHRSADRIALALHFPSGSAFRNTCQRYLHATPSEIRARGGASFVMDAMLRDTTTDGGDESDSAASEGELAAALTPSVTSGAPDADSAPGGAESAPPTDL